MKNIMILLCLLAMTITCQQKHTPADGKSLFIPAYYDDFTDCLEKGDPEAQSILSALKQEAEQILQERRPSVVYKKQLPVSGDIHDYYSMGPYWWPDSSKSDGLPWIRRDGLVNPLTRGENVDTPEKSRMASYTTKLAALYYLTGEERYAEGCAGVLRTWFLDESTRMNPHLEYAQAIPGRTDGRDIGIIDFSGMKDILVALEIIRDSDAWTDEDQAGMNDWLSRYLDWVLNSENGKGEMDKRNNHATWIHAHVSALAIYLGKDSIAESLIMRMFDRLPDHLDPDGSQPHELARTRAISYSVYNLSGWFTLAENAELLGMDLWTKEVEGRSLKSAVDFLVENAFEGDWSYEEVSGLEAARQRLRRLIAYAAKHYDDPRYDAISRSIGYDCLYGLAWHDVID